MLYCQRCPIEKYCKDTKKRILEPFKEEYRKEIEKRLKDYCPLKSVLNLIKKQVLVILDSLPLYKAFSNWSKLVDVLGTLAKNTLITKIEEVKEDEEKE